MISSIIFDVDGVLTDGRIILNDLGVESKHFHVRDGFAIRAAMLMGLKVGIITGRMSRVVALRAAELGIEHVQQGSKDKGVALEALCERMGVTPDQTAFVGDDLIDLPALLRCGYPIAVKDSVDEVRAVAKYITAQPGGHGAARDAVEHILKKQNRWEELLQHYQR